MAVTLYATTVGERRRKGKEMLVKEFRVPLPLKVEDFHRGQLYGVVETSKAETGGGDGVQIVRNEPFRDRLLLGGRYTSGQYTHKIYYLKSKVPALIRRLAPEGSLVLHEESWNAYPYCKTIVTVRVHSTVSDHRQRLFAEPRLHEGRFLHHHRVPASTRQRRHRKRLLSLLSSFSYGLLFRRCNCRRSCWRREASFCWT